MRLIQTMKLDPNLPIPLSDQADILNKIKERELDKRIDEILDRQTHLNAPDADLMPPSTHLS